MIVNSTSRISKKTVLEVLLLIGIGIIIYIVAGREWILIEDDSPSYLNPTGYFGIMPGYILLIQAIRSVVGNAYLLNTLVLFQSILAIACTVIFSLYIRKQFNLKSIELILVFIISAMPFCIYLPDYGVTHEVMTEAIAYSIMYIYFYYCLRTVIERKVKYFLIVMVLSVIMGIIRSQLLILGIFSGFLLFFLFGRKDAIEKTSIFCFKKLLLVIVIILSIIVNVILVYLINGLYLDNILPYIQDKSSDNQFASVSDNIIDFAAKGLSSNHQVSDLIRIKGWYEADREDEAIFDTENEKEIFRKIYDELDEKEYLYKYANNGLYMWRDLTKDKIPFVTNPVCLEYYDDEFTATMYDTKMALQILLHHFGRASYHFFRICVQSFIAAIFFQIEKIYLLCHVITAFLYLLYFVGMFMVRRISQKEYLFALLTILLLFLIVVLTNVVFWGMQRYVVYCMGLFYISLYLMYSKIISNIRNDVDREIL